MTSTDISTLIPAEAVEAVARRIAAAKMLLFNSGENLPDDLWKQCVPEARAAIAAMLRAWPGAETQMDWQQKKPEFLILPLPTEPAP